MTGKEQYVNALDCGHRTYWSDYPAVGIEWCPSCAMYRGVMVNRVDIAARPERAATGALKNPPCLS